MRKENSCDGFLFPELFDPPPPRAEPKREAREEKKAGPTARAEEPEKEGLTAAEIFRAEAWSEGGRILLFPKEGAERIEAVFSLCGLDLTAESKGMREVFPLTQWRERKDFSKLERETWERYIYY